MKIDVKIQVDGKTLSVGQLKRKAAAAKKEAETATTKYFAAKDTADGWAKEAETRRATFTALNAALVPFGEGLTPPPKRRKKTSQSKDVATKTADAATRALGRQKKAALDALKVLQDNGITGEKIDKLNASIDAIDLALSAFE